MGRSKINLVSVVASLNWILTINFVYGKKCVHYQYSIWVIKLFMALLKQWMDDRVMDALAEQKKKWRILNFSSIVWVLIIWLWSDNQRIEPAILFNCPWNRMFARENFVASLHFNRLKLTWMPQFLWFLVFAPRFKIRHVFLLLEKLRNYYRNSSWKCNVSWKTLKRSVVARRPMLNYFNFIDNRLWIGLNL